MIGMQLAEVEAVPVTPGAQSPWGGFRLVGSLAPELKLIWVCLLVLSQLPAWVLLDLAVSLAFTRAYVPSDMMTRMTEFSGTLVPPATMRTTDDLSPG